MLPRDKTRQESWRRHRPHVLGVLGPGAGDVVAGWTPLRRLELSRGRHAVGGRMVRAVWVIPREVFDARLAGRPWLDRHLHHTWLAGRLTRRPAVVEAGITAPGGNQRTFDDVVGLGSAWSATEWRAIAALAAGALRARVVATG